MKKALIVAPTFPYPIDGGNLVALHGYHVALRKAGFDEVHFIGFADEGRKVDHQFEQCCLVPKPRKFTLPGLVRHALGASLLFERYISVELEATLAAFLKRTPYSAILFQHGYMAQYMARVSHLVPAGCITVASPEALESRAFNTKAKLANSALAAMLMRRESRILDRRETQSFDSCARVAFFSEEDRAHYLRQGGVADARVVNLGIEVDRYAYVPKAPPHPGEPLVLAFFGALSWFANVDALNHLLDDIWPVVRDHNPNVILRLAGRGMSEDMPIANRERLEIFGRVDSIEEFLRGVDIVLSPIRIGGGIRLKILESLAYGKHVVSTTIGLEGLADEVLGMVTRADTPQQFAEVVHALSQDPARLRKYAEEGSEAVRRLYDANNLRKLFT